MYGHAVAELLQRGVDVPDELVDRARRGLRFLLHQRGRTPGGLVALCHPWESGCDDSARWDHWGAAGRGWFDAKGALLSSIERSDTGAPIANPAFAVGGASFNALVAFNALELGRAVDDDDLVAGGDELADAVASRWDDDRRTWVDDGSSEDGSGRVRTVDALLVGLVRPRDDASAQLVDPAAHGAAFGPTGTHRSEPSFDPRAYWRGGTWPQIAYLLWLASTRSRSDDVAASLSRSIHAGVVRSGFAEYWEPDTGEGLGAVPQSWATLALLVA
jgi:glycogen debranching enzyme